MSDIVLRRETDDRRRWLPTVGDISRLPPQSSTRDRHLTRERYRQARLEGRRRENGAASSEVVRDV
jgi:hypothetical protein